MAPIRKAKSYVAYLVALLISGLFATFHKAPPAWAEEVRADRSAQVFTSMYKGTVVAENTPTEIGNRTATVYENKYILKKTAGNRDVPRIAEEQRLMPLTPTSPEKAANSVNNALGKIYLKLDKGEEDTLTPEENALIMSAETAQQFRDLQNQVTVLMQMVKDLQDKAANK